MSRSFFGSMRDKLSRSPSTGRAPDHSHATQVPSPHQTASQATQSDLPPPYSATAATAGPSSSNPNAASAVDNDPYAFLTNFDTVFLIDDSLSMASSNRWREAEAALRAINPICTSHDADGVDIYFLNHRSNGSSSSVPEGKADGGYYGITSPNTVSQIFKEARPSGATPTGQRLRQIMKPYITSLERASDPDSIKPINIIVITDGRATDEPDEIIVNAAARLDRLDAAPSQIGIQFFQIGEDADAAEALRSLDDDLKQRGVRDMVDTCGWGERRKRGGNGLTSDVILKVVLGAVLRRLDNKTGRR